MMSLDIILFKFSRIKVYVVVLLEIADSFQTCYHEKGKIKLDTKPVFVLDCFQFGIWKTWETYHYLKKKAKSLKSQNWVLEKISNVSTFQSVNVF